MNDFSRKIRFKTDNLNEKSSIFFSVENKKNAFKDRLLIFIIINLKVSFQLGTISYMLAEGYAPPPFSGQVHTKIIYKFLGFKHDHEKKRVI